MIVVVDRNDGYVVQKVVRPKGPACYQVVPKDAIGDASKVIVRDSLIAARALIGKGPSGKPLQQGA